MGRAFLQSAAMTVGRIGVLKAGHRGEAQMGRENENQDE
jgi:hypothetical protein